MTVTVEQVRKQLGHMDSTLGELVVYEVNGEIFAVAICSHCNGAARLRLAGEVGKVHCDECSERGCAAASMIVALNGGSLGLRVRRG